ncbi:MAG: peptidoglycan DD-metalloendopeptidase family protein [Proteobacteria bacterium]|nr:peptidoglycan DD-metalloendopeptidase family protein [Pseudomonadota bacterium]
MNKIFLLIICVLFSSKLLANPSPSTTINQKSQQLNTIKTQINQLQKNLSVTQDKRDGLNQELKKTEIEIGNITNELSTLEQNVQKQNSSLAQVLSSQKKQQQQLDDQRALLAQQIRAHYTLGREETIKILLNQQNLSQLNRITLYYQHIYDARKKSLLKIQKTLDELNQTQQKMTQIKESLEFLKQQKELKHNTILEKQTLQKNFVSALNKKITSEGSQLKELEKDKKSLEELISRMRLLSLANYQPGVPFSKLRQKLIWPVKGPIITRYGDRLAHSFIKSNGLKIKAHEGQEVRSVYSGKVLFADWLRGFGLLIILDHGQGYMTLYANNKNLYKKPNEIVQAGELIATAGHSGGNNENGLYFEIRKNGKPENPKHWLKPT